MEEITQFSNWIPFLTENKASKNFNQFIDKIQELDDGSSPDLWVKWKNYFNQVVIETPNYYYKIYLQDICGGMFISHLRANLGKIYQEKFNIKWDVQNIITNNSIYTIEQRQKLPLSNSSIIDFEDLLINWSKTLQLLEDSLEFKLITKQLQEYIPSLNKIKLVRDCVNKYDDYAIIDGNIVLLDDADWFIALLDKNDNWLNIPADIYRINTSYLGEANFMSTRLCEDRLSIIDHIGMESNQWIINCDDFYGQTGLKSELINIKENMLKYNIEILNSNKRVSLENRKYIVPLEENDYITTTFIENKGDLNDL